MFTCEFCGIQQRTQKGLRSHQAQGQACRRRATKFATVAKSSQSPCSDPSFQDNSSVDASSSNTSGSEHSKAHPENPDVAAGDYDNPILDIPFEPPSTSLAPEKSPTPDNHKRQQTEVEEVEDDPSNDPISIYDPRSLWAQAFAQDAEAGKMLCPCQTKFEAYCEQQKAAKQEPWAPFGSEEEWELARWLMESGASQKKIDSFLKLKKVPPGFYVSSH